MNPYIRALLRFWWILLLGVLVACLAAVSMQYRIDMSSFPPQLTERASSTYSTTARVLVTSSEVPHLRISLSRPVTAPAPAGGGGAAAVAAVEERPDLGILVRVANIYPLLIESDQVAQLRDQLYGRIPGVVSAQGIFSISNAQRFEPTTLPVIEIFAASDSPARAMELAQHTVDAFTTYITDQQDRARLKPNERIKLQQIQRPRGVFATGGSSLGLPMLVVVVVMAAFATLAVLLDRIFPTQRTQAEALVERLERHVSASDTA
jgi:hypothetical protein